MQSYVLVHAELGCGTPPAVPVAASICPQPSVRLRLKRQNVCSGRSRGVACDLSRAYEVVPGQGMPLPIGNDWRRPGIRGTDVSFYENFQLGGANTLLEHCNGRAR